MEIINTNLNRFLRRHGGKPSGVKGQSAVAPLFSPELASNDPKTNEQRLAEYQAKYTALTCKGVAA